MPKAKPKKSAGARSASSASGSYYYAQGQRIPVEKRDDLIAVEFRERAPETASTAFGASRSSDLQLSDEFPELQGGNLRLYRAAGNRSVADLQAASDLRSEPDVSKIGEVYTNEHGKPLVLTETLVAKFQPEMTRDRISQLLAERGLEIAETIGFSENTFLLKALAGRQHNALEAANDLFEKGHTVYAHPEWIEHVNLRHTVSDPLFANQWHLENSGASGGAADADVDAHGAWHHTLGDPNLRIAIVDNGIDINHEDLNVPGKIVDPLDLNVTPPDNDPTGGSHGTSCAGVATAAQNGRGVSGIAPACRLIPIRASSDQTTTQLRLARAFVYAADRRAAVISCSLGPDGVPWVMQDVMRDALDYATTYGRNGRGSVVFWAGGNGNESISTDQICSYERTIAVGATNNLDQRSSYSDFGPELDVMAPSNGGTLGITTITNTGTGNPAVDPSRNYINNFGGTSSASPLAAGTGALVLSVNAGLSWQEVRQVLMDTAEKVDAAANPYLPAAAPRPPGTRNDRYGYGRINAERAVNLARNGSRRDLFIRDTIADTGSVPQPAFGFWNSPDIWVRNNDDGLTTHQNTIRGRDNFIYTRIWNRGSQDSLPCWARFYIASYAGTEFRYPFDFKFDTTAEPGGGTAGNLKPRASFPALGTYLVGVQRIQSIPAGGSVVSKVRWERSLIPPATTWHPCLLVEVSPHDGPLPAGQHTWENNNLGQKNISIVNVRPGAFIEFPFSFSHLLNKDDFVNLQIVKTKAPVNAELFLDVKNPRLLDAIGKANAAGSRDANGDAMATLPPFDATGFSPGSRVTFLEEARMALSTVAVSSAGQSLILKFPKGSSVEWGRQQQAAGLPDDFTNGLQDVEPVSEEEAVAALSNGNDHRAQQFKIGDLLGSKVIALRPELKRPNIVIPQLEGGLKNPSLKVKVPANAVPGDSYIFDLVQRNKQGQIVGGVQLQANVIA